MKKTIRRKVFETNSSTCHCLTVIKQDELERLFHDQYGLVVHLPDTGEYCTDDKYEIMTIEEAYDKLIKWHADHKDDTSVNDRYWFKTLNEVIDQLTFEKFVEKLYDHNDDVDLGSLDQYELIDCLESALDATQVLVSGSYKDPLDTAALEKPKGIKGDMVIISTEVEC